MSKVLKRDEFAGLEQVGHSPQENVPLARVFVDLPVELNQVGTPGEQAANKPQLVAFIKHMLAIAPYPLQDETGSPLPCILRQRQDALLVRTLQAGLWDSVSFSAK